MTWQRPTLPFPQVVPTGDTHGGRTVWRLITPLNLTVDLGPGIAKYQIREGTETDFASIPRLFSWVISPTSVDILVPSLIHDRLYAHDSVPRFLADAIFRDLMREYGAPLWKRVAAFWAVRCFGWLYRKP